MPVEAELLEPPTGEAVSDSVQRHLDTREFTVRASQLTEEIQRADQQREEHFRKTFERRIGNLADTSQGEPQPAAAGSQKPAESPAATIARMLASPEGVRQAIVLNEILARPAERW